MNAVNSPDTCWPAEGFQNGGTASGKSGTTDNHHLTHCALRKTIAFVERGIQISKTVWGFRFDEMMN
jgi:hypothetical protein